MMLNDNSLLQHFEIPEKKRQASTTQSKYINSVQAIKNTYHSLVLLKRN